MKLGKEIHDALMLDPSEFGEPLSFPLVSQVDQGFIYPVKYLKIYWMDWHKPLYKHS